MVLEEIVCRLLNDTPPSTIWQRFAMLSLGCLDAVSSGNKIH